MAVNDRDVASGSLERPALVPQEPDVSLQPHSGAEIPPLAARVARAASPRGISAMWIRDRLDGLWSDEDFTAWYPRDGRPGLSPAQLATVCVLQYAMRTSPTVRPLRRCAAESTRRSAAWSDRSGSAWCPQEWVICRRVFTVVGTAPYGSWVSGYERTRCAGPPGGPPGGRRRARPLARYPAGQRGRDWRRARRRSWGASEW